MNKVNALKINNARLQRIAEAEIQSGERLLWAGQPLPKLMCLQRESLILSGFGALWTAAVISISRSYWQGERQLPIGLPALIMMSLFLILGFPMLFAPVIAYFRARQTVYAITDDYVYIIQQGKSRVVKSYAVREFSASARTEKEGGYGNIALYKRNAESDAEGQLIGVSLFGISNVVEVDQLLKSLFLGSD